jgi:hypothetical protein
MANLGEEVPAPRQGGEVQTYRPSATRQKVDHWAEDNSLTPIYQVFFVSHPGARPPKAEKREEGQADPRAQWYRHAFLYFLAGVFSLAWLVVHAVVWIVAEGLQWLAGHPLRMFVVGGALTAAGWFVLTHYLR